MTFFKREGIFEVREDRSLKEVVHLFDKGKPRVIWGRKIVRPWQCIVKDWQIAEMKKS